MKNLVIIILICLQQAEASTYYVSGTGGTGDGLSEESAWSYSKFNATNISPGSVILFKKGDTFYGKLNIISGFDNKINTYGAYGTGANPVISGFTALNSWTLANDNIYYTTLNVPELNVVTVDGKLKSMGRFPKKGYLIFSEHSGTNSITGASIGNLPFNPTGAEVVIRKYRQITDRHKVISYSGNTIGLSSAGAYGTVFLNNNNDAPMDGNGYFIQSHLRTLTELGDWYYDSAFKRLYMHFGNGNPNDHTINASTMPVFAQMDNKSYITIKDIDFEGANREVINMNNNNFITISKCNFSKSFGAVTADNGIANLTIQGGSMSDIVNSAVLVGSRAINITIDGVTMTNIGTIPGAGGSGGAQQLGVWLVGDNLTVRNCSLKNIGYHGIVLYGDNTLIEGNLIDTYGLVKDDCGGVYDFQFTGIVSRNKIIRKNIILNGIGAVEGAPAWEQYGQASAIYLDVAVNNVKVYDNVLAHGTWGGLLLVGSGVNIDLNNNLVYDFAKGLLIYSYEKLPIRDIIVTDNIIIAKTRDQSALYLQMFAKDNPSLYGIFNDNIYAKPLSETNLIAINNEYVGGEGATNISLDKWKSDFYQDLNSFKSTAITDSEDNLNFYYNYSNAEITIPLNSSHSDVAGKSYTSNIKLPAYGGIVLIKTLSVDFVHSLKSGNWTDATIWSGGHVPGSSDSVIINQGHIINVQQDILVKSIKVSTGAELRFLGDYKVNNRKNKVVTKSP